MIEWLKGGLILAGTFFMFVAALGVLRLPDLLTRMHATTKAATLGAALIMLAVALHFAQAVVVARAFGVIIFIMITAPVAAHVIGRAGYFVGAQLWSGTVKDELKPNYNPDTHQLESRLAPGDDDPTGSPRHRDSG
ncbi:multicomponent Na+:H+ antiporter subunit G [Modicisalibacter ilicicola DSM 19980]|uniref:Multicomponent Na+:H+ antiporter subunit G n=1 Tax=Modicisalibacter ilicicola DSM 19980 TaxID=1121942 RepID=A0A1M4UHC3_9GAMM|nr:monovalent cation/H(+) antiporter subunit G [Halomonas ilicicola]SHE56054.1 multicomponent Na+:H+ antiporter subunit G [Halomonas ilicicola DSM 19980]